MIGEVVFFRRKGDRIAHVRIHGCANQWVVVGIKYRMCFVCIIERKNYRYFDGAIGREEA